MKALTTSLLGFDMCGVVCLHSVQELLTASRVLDVLHTQVHALLDVSVSNNFVNDDTDRAWCDVVNDSSTAVQCKSIL